MEAFGCCKTFDAVAQRENIYDCNFVAYRELPFDGRWCRVGFMFGSGTAAAIGVHRLSRAQITRQGITPRSHAWNVSAARHVQFSARRCGNIDLILFTTFINVFY
jgi:hypothetical protein